MASYVISFIYSSITPNLNNVRPILDSDNEVVQIFNHQLGPLKIYNHINNFKNMFIFNMWANNSKLA